MVLVKAGDGLLEGGDAVDQLDEAVAAQAATLEASVAAGAEASVLVSVEAKDVAAAREAARRIVGTALERVGRSGAGGGADRFRRGRTGRLPALRVVVGGLGETSSETRANAASEATGSPNEEHQDDRDQANRAPEHPAVPLTSRDGVPECEANPNVSADQNQERNGGGDDAHPSRVRAMSVSAATCRSATSSRSTGAATTSCPTRPAVGRSSRPSRDVAELRTEHGGRPLTDYPAPGRPEHRALRRAGRSPGRAFLRRRLRSPGAGMRKGPASGARL
jgi:hypothetical protein